MDLKSSKDLAQRNLAEPLKELLSVLTPFEKIEISMRIEKKRKEKGMEMRNEATPTPSL